MIFFVLTQVKKLQVMLRQANDQLEKTMKDKQELEDYMKQSAEDSSNQVQAFCNQDGRNHEVVFKNTYKNSSSVRYGWTNCGRGNKSESF